MSNKSLLSFAICFVSLTSFFGGAIYVSALPEFSQIFDVSATAIKYTITSYYVGIMLGTVFLAPISKMVNQKHVMVASLLLGSIGHLTCATSVDILQFIIGRFIAGLGTGGTPVLAAAFVAKEFNKEEYKRLLTYLLVMISIGLGASPLVGSILFHFFSWPVLFLTLAAFQIFAATMFVKIKLKEKSFPEKLQQIYKDYLTLFKHPVFIYYCIIIGILYGTFYSFLIISSYIFRLNYGWSIIDFAWIGLALGITNSIGAYLDKTLIDRMKGQNLFLLGHSLIGLVIILFYGIGLPEKGVWVLCIASLFIIGQNLVASYLTTISLKLNPKHTNIASSFIFFSKGALASLLLFIVPLFPKTLGYANLILLVSFVICSLGYFKIRKSL